MNKSQLMYCVLALSVVPESARSEERGNPTAGYRLAQDVCVECHATGLGIKFSPNLLAPPFHDIADTPGMNGLALSVW